MNRNPKKYLFDISSSITTIFDDYLNNVDSFEQYESNSMIQDAVERRLTIIGEALNKLRQQGVKLQSSDPIINRRNTLVHQYDEYNPRKVWQSIHRELPSLKEEVDRLLVL